MNDPPTAGGWASGAALRTPGPPASFLNSNGEPRTKERYNDGMTQTPQSSPSIASTLRLGRIGRRGFVTTSLSGVAASLALSQSATQRPEFELGEGSSFDAGTITPYRGHHPEVYRYIDQHLERHVRQLQRWVRQPSVSAQNIGIQEMAEMLAGDLRQLGFQEVQLVPTSGHPGVWGTYDAGPAKTLMIYLMYDVQPVNPEDWQVPPFEGALVESPLGTVLMARGATNQKGPERAFLNALEAILACDGKPPVNLLVAAEGEEELGSPHYPEFIEKFLEPLQTADACFFPFNSQNSRGELGLNLGVKGILYFEMEARGGAQGGPTRAEIHGSYKAIVDAPAWRLVQALACLTSGDGNRIEIPGYYDDVRPPSDEERELIRGLMERWDEELIRQALGVEKWLGGGNKEETIMRYLYEPTLNIDGIWSGYTGEGTKTILPHIATAKVDSRLPPNLRPEKALALIREQLDRNGFQDIVIRQMSGYPASQTSVHAPIVRSSIGVFNKYDHTPVVWPRLAGSAPFYVFTERLGLPLVPAGLGHGSGAHAPNEYMLIHPKAGSPVAGLAEIEKGYADLLYSFAGG